MVSSARRTMRSSVPCSSSTRSGSPLGIPVLPSGSLLRLHWLVKWRSERPVAHAPERDPLLARLPAPGEAEDDRDVVGIDEAEAERDDVGSVWRREVGHVD